MSALSLEAVSKKFDRTLAVDDLSFSVPEGQVFGFLGGNGAGKTTTLRMALDIIRPSAGRLTVLGRPPGRANARDVGFLPEERAWMTRIFDELGLVDVHRVVNQEPEQYTWWSNRGQAWAKNVGWRIDYHVATPGIAAKAHAVAIYKDERFSDHAPLIIDYAL